MRTNFFNITIGILVLFGIICNMTIAEEESMKPVNTLYLLRKFDSILVDANFVKKNLKDMDDKLLQASVNDINERLRSFQMFKHRNPDIELWGQRKGVLAGDAIRYVSLTTDSVALSITGIGLDDIKKPGFIHQNVVEPLGKIRSRLLFLCGKAPNPWGEGGDRKEDKNNNSKKDPK